MITVLSGGPCGAKFLEGLRQVIPLREITVIANTASDFFIAGVRICPDLDASLAALGGFFDRDRGYGFRPDTFRVYEALREFGRTPWYRIGDREMALSLLRHYLLEEVGLFEATMKIAETMRVRGRVLPITEDPIFTRVIVNGKAVEPVRVRIEKPERVEAISYEGVDEASPGTLVEEAITEADAIVIAPGDPLVDIGPMLAIRGVKELIEEAKAKKILISPFSGGKPNDPFLEISLKTKGKSCDVLSVAEYYEGLVDLAVVDIDDVKYLSRMRWLGIRGVIADTSLETPENEVALAEVIANIIRL